MDKEKLRNIIYIVVAVLLSILAIQFIIWLLPIILVVILALWIYSSMKGSHTKTRTNTKETRHHQKDKKVKKIVIIDQEEDQDK